jgi:uncharacterized protein (DUF736 family)
MNKENTGAIFKNEKKTTDNQPDYKGTINVDGKEKEIALWVAESKNGLKYFSVKVTEPFKTDAKPQPKEYNADNPSDLPF